MNPETFGGHLIEFGEAKQIFNSPRDERTEAYISGRFGSHALSVWPRLDRLNPWTRLEPTRRKRPHLNTLHML